MQKLFSLLIIILLLNSCDNGTYSKDEYSKQRVKRVAFEKKDISIEKTIPLIGDSLSVDKKTIKIIKEVNNKIEYHIIAASSTNEKTAKALVLVYKKQNCSPKIINLEGRFRISIDSFDTMEEATEKKEIYSKLLHKTDLWIFKH